MLLYFVHVRFGLFMLFKPTLIMFKNRAVKKYVGVGPGHIILSNLSLYNITLQYISN